MEIIDASELIQLVIEENKQQHCNVMSAEPTLALSQDVYSKVQTGNANKTCTVKV